MAVPLVVTQVFIKEYIHDEGEKLGKCTLACIGEKLGKCTLACIGKYEG